MSYIKRTIAESGVFWCCPTSWRIVPSCPVPHIITFLNCRGGRHTIAYVCGCVYLLLQQSSLFYMACTFLSWCYESCVQVFFFFCRCQMCLHPLPCSPFPSLWFLHGRRVSIRASGLQEPEHSSLSVLPREVQPCLGRCICSLGASWGKRANPGAPACWFLSVGAA